MLQAVYDSVLPHTFDLNMIRNSTKKLKSRLCFFIACETADGARLKNKFTINGKIYKDQLHQNQKVS